MSIKSIPYLPRSLKMEIRWIGMRKRVLVFSSPRGQRTYEEPTTPTWKDIRIRGRVTWIGEDHPADDSSRNTLDKKSAAAEQRQALKNRIRHYLCRERLQAGIPSSNERVRSWGEPKTQLMATILLATGRHRSHLTTNVVTSVNHPVPIKVPPYDGNIHMVLITPYKFKVNFDENL